jgi:DNA-binding MarR family transcriptional regulator
MVETTAIEINPTRQDDMVEKVIGEGRMKKKTIKKPVFLTSKQFQEVADLYDEGYTQPELARQFNVNQGHISRIINGPPPFSIQESRSARSVAIKNYKAPKYKSPYAKKWIQSGRDSDKAKLTFKKAQTIRHLYFQGLHSQWDLAKKFGVGQGQVCKVIAGKTWKKIK